MSLATYGDLKTSIAAWLHRTDLSTLVAYFVALAEADIRMDVRCRGMETTATGTLAAETLAHPSRYLEAKLLKVGNYELDYITTAQYYLLPASDVSKVYTSVGTNLLIKPATGDYTLIYYAMFASFSADADTNWLLTNAPDVYLSGSLRHAARWMQDAEAEQIFAQRYAASVARLKTTENKGVGRL